MYRGDIDIFTFQGLSGLSDAVTITLGAKWDMNFKAYYPDGTFSSGGSGPGALHIHTSSQTGTYTVVIYKWSGADTPLSYTATFSGTNIALPTSAQADGAYSDTCNGQISADSASLPNAQGGSNVAEPVNVATGNLYEGVTDYSTAGQNVLCLTRYYNSVSYQRNLYQTLIGNNWRTNYDRYLRLTSTKLVAAERP